MTDSGQNNSKRVATRWQAFINANANYVNYPCYCPLGRNSTVTQPVTSIQRSPPSLSIRSPLASVVIYNIPITSGDSVQILFSWNESEVPQCRPMCVSWGVRVREWWDNVMDLRETQGNIKALWWGEIEGTLGYGYQKWVRKHRRLGAIGLYMGYWGETLRGNWGNNEVWLLRGVLESESFISISQPLYNGINW